MDRASHARVGGRRVTGQEGSGPACDGLFLSADPLVAPVVFAVADSSSKCAGSRSRCSGFAVSFVQSGVAPDREGRRDDGRPMVGVTSVWGAVLING